MARTYTAPSRTATRSVSSNTAAPSGSSLSTGAIAGIAVGGAAVLAAVVAGVWYFCVRRKRQQKYAYGKPGSTAPTHSQTFSGGSMNGQFGLGLGGAAGGPPSWSRSPGSSHHTPASPYGPGQSSPWLQHQQMAAVNGRGAIIPSHPIEMPGNVYDSGASEMYDGGTGTGTGSTGMMSPYSASGTDSMIKPDLGGAWPAPLHHEVTGVSPVHVAANSPHQHPSGTPYVDGGFGPRELSGDPVDGPMTPSGTNRQHETFYHQ